MKKRPNLFGKIEEIGNGAKNFTGRVYESGKTTLLEADKKLHLLDAAKEVVESVTTQLSDLSEKHHLPEKAESCAKNVNKGLSDLKKSRLAQGVGDAITVGGRIVQEIILEPADKVLEQSGANDLGRSVSSHMGNLYGTTRAYMKPYFAPDTPEELLRNTKNELLYINSCILQVNKTEAERYATLFGKAVASKLGGLAAAGGLVGLVSAFGTAGTGTAIASLSGAAANSATLAWLGGLFGGGMATGAVVTGGVAVVVGVVTYKLLGSEARKIEDLSEIELRVIESTGILIAAINELLNDPGKTLKITDAEGLLNNTLIPLHHLLKEHAAEISANLDFKNRTFFNQHALIDFEKVVLDGFTFFIEGETRTRRARYPEFAIAGVLYALLSQSPIDDSRESQLALKAIRRVSNQWNDASQAELSQILSTYSPERLRGLANNAKGIYHELLFVDDYNATHSETYAEIHAATNHQGSDVMIRSKETDELLGEFQLKAGSSSQIIREHFEKYPDIDVLATEEIAGAYGAVSSNINNQEITTHMNEVMDELGNNTVFDQATEAMQLAGLVAAGKAALDVLGGKQGVNQAGIQAAASVGVATSSTAIVAYLFS